MGTRQPGLVSVDHSHCSERFVRLADSGHSAGLPASERSSYRSHSHHGRAGYTYLLLRCRTHNSRGQEPTDRMNSDLWHLPYGSSKFEAEPKAHDYAGQGCGHGHRLRKPTPGSRKRGFCNFNVFVRLGEKILACGAYEEMFFHRRAILFGWHAQGIFLPSLGRKMTIKASVH